MQREEMFKHLKLDTSKMSTEELFRQTGRTTRMVEAAVYRAREGRLVTIVMKDTAAVQWVLKYIEDMGKVPRIRVTHYNQNFEPIFDWATLKGIGVHSEHEMFIDHDVIYFNNRALFEAMSKYDPKVKIEGDTMTFVDERVPVNDTIETN